MPFPQKYLAPPRHVVVSPLHYAEMTFFLQVFRRWDSWLRHVASYSLGFKEEGISPFPRQGLFPVRPCCLTENSPAPFPEKAGTLRARDFPRNDGLAGLPSWREYRRYGISGSLIREACKKRWGESRGCGASGTPFNDRGEAVGESPAGRGSPLFAPESSFIQGEPLRAWSFPPPAAGGTGGGRSPCGCGAS